MYTSSLLTAECPLANLLHLSLLPYIQNASWDPHGTCIPGTHTSLINDIIHWFPRTATNERIYLLLGSARSGKSSVSHTIAQILRNKGRLGSSIFLAREIEGRKSTQAVFSTIARDLAAFDDKIGSGISRAIELDTSLPSAPLDRQFRELIVGPTQDLTIIGPILIVIDGLDECENIKDRGRLLHVLTRQSERLPANFRILVTARPESDIEMAFRDVEQKCWRLDVKADGRDVSTYLSERMADLTTTKPALFGTYSFDTVLTVLTQRAMEVHLWALTSAEFLSHCTDADATRFLEKLRTQPTPISAEASINHLYDAILSVILAEPDVNMGWQAILQAVVKSQLPSLLSTIESLSSLSTSSGCHPFDVLYRIGCILDIGDSHSVVLHPAFEAYITNGERCTDHRFFVDVATDYDPIAEVCLHVMNNLLSYDICQIGDSSLLNSELSRNQIIVDQFVPESLRYVSQHWITLVLETKGDLGRVLEQLRRFLFEHLLHWIELSSLMGQIQASLASLRRLYEWLEVSVFRS
jgi:hypothetical protein